MPESWSQVETPPVEVGRLLAAGVLGHSEEALTKAAQICTSVVPSDEYEAEALGKAHAVREIGRAALGERPDLVVPPVKACEICSASTTDERFCTRIGKALGSGDVRAAAEVLVDFDAKASRAHNIEHARGISRAANEIVGVAAVYRNRRAVEADDLDEDD